MCMNRHAVTSCQRLSCDDDLLHMEASMYGMHESLSLSVSVQRY